MNSRLPLLLLLAPLLGACVTTSTGSVAGGECKFLERPTYAVRGLRPYDQDWIDSTVEGGIGACKWQRPAPRPQEIDRPIDRPIGAPSAKASPAKPVKKKPKWLALLRAWPKRTVAPVIASPGAPAAVVAPVVAEPFPIRPPAPRSAVDDLLDPEAGK